VGKWEGEVDVGCGGGGGGGGGGARGGGKRAGHLAQLLPNYGHTYYLWLYLLRRLAQLLGGGACIQLRRLQRRLRTVQPPSLLRGRGRGRVKVRVRVRVRVQRVRVQPPLYQPA
jgi:hypothetical protein